MARGARLLPPLALFLTALVCRLAAIGRYVTPDELNWVYRSLGLRRALLAGDWQHTLQSGHPGVTTTWIGAIAAQVQLWLQPDLQARLAWLERMQQLSPDNVEAFRQLYAFLNSGRLGVALVISLGLVLAYLLSRELLGVPAAFLATMLLALDPFFAGLSGLLHVDALLSMFILLALLLALKAARHAQSWRLAAACGLLTALAILMKTPGLILLAFVPLILLWPAFSALRTRRRDSEDTVYALRQVVVWGGVTLIVAPILLPALWAAPGYVWDTISGLSGRLLEDAVRPTFFLGQTALDHGSRYYPIVMLFRISPVVTIGLALVLAQLRGEHTTDRVTARWLLLFALVFIIAITLAAKKFDRYALPALVAFTMVAGWGLVQAAARWRLHDVRLVASALLLQAAVLISVWPHPLTAANWLVGGQLTSRHVLASGWGEDAGLAARTLSKQLPQPQASRLFSSSLTGTAPFFPGEIVRLRTPNLTRLQAQDFILSLPQDRQLEAVIVPQPSPTVVPVKGIGAATLQTGLDASDLQLRAFEFEPRRARFGTALHLEAAGSAFLPWPQETLVGLSWRIDLPAAPEQSYRLQLELVDEVGQTWLQREFLLLNKDDHAPLHWPADTPQEVFYSIQLPPTLAPGEYTWVARVFDGEGRQQAVFDVDGAFAGTQARLMAISVTPPEAQPAFEIPNRGEGIMAGYAPLPPSGTAGDPFSLELWLRVHEPAQLELTLEAGANQQHFALDARTWRPGQVYRVRPVWRLPLDLEAGDQRLTLIVRDLNTEAVLAGPLPLGELAVERRERRFELPASVEPLQLAIGDFAWLQNVAVEPQEDRLLVHVMWQARTTTFETYTTFMHLRDGADVIGGDDRQPFPPTSTWAPGEVIQETYTLPRPEPGTYTVAMGLYRAADGVRLPLRDRAGQLLNENQFLLPVEVP